MPESISRLYTAVAFDLDGTLVNSDKVVPAFTRSEVCRVQAEGATLIFASSRMPRSIRKVMAEIGAAGSVVAYNGARVEATADERAVDLLYDDPMDAAVLRHVLSASGRPPLGDLHMGLFFGDTWAVSALDYWALREVRTSQTWPDHIGIDDLPDSALKQGLHKLMLRGEARGITEALAPLRQLDAEISIYRPKGDIAEVTSARSVKSAGVRRVLDALGKSTTREKAAQLIAFGDNLNDEDMLREAALGIAVSNAHEALLAAADEITLSNDEDGVGYALRKHFPSARNGFRPG